MCLKYSKIYIYISRASVWWRQNVMYWTLLWHQQQLHILFMSLTNKFSSELNPHTQHAWLKAWHDCELKMETGRAGFLQIKLWDWDTEKSTIFCKVLFNCQFCALLVLLQALQVNHCIMSNTLNSLCYMTGCVFYFSSRQEGRNKSHKFKMKFLHKKYT